MMPGYPENCIESCEKTLSLMPTFFEIDFSFTKDSVMVLMHDLTIDRTTTGKGRVADYTYEELQQFMKEHGLSKQDSRESCIQSVENYLMEQLPSPLPVRGS